MFEEFPKIGRLKRDMVITEKIDGTNAQVHIVALAELSLAESDALRPKAIAYSPTADLVMLAGSRNRYITPTDDNFGFAKWVQAHAEELWALGEGRHYGEWWGSGVQRGYGLTNGEKRFSLFNVNRWQSEGNGTPRPACCSVVPVLKRWTFDTTVIDEVLADLAANGSQAAPGFMKPEGIVVFQAATRTMFKRTIEKDDEPKGKTAAA
jgi:hypothetical protein